MTNTATAKNLARQILATYNLTGEQAMTIARRTVKFVELGVFATGQDAVDFARSEAAAL